MNMSIFVLAFCGYLGGLLVISRTLRWAMTLRNLLGRPSGGTTARGPWPVVAFLHSGPWMLALAIGGVWHVASLHRPDLLWALAGGFAFAVVLIAGLTVRRKPQAPVPLTPERLAQKRREFFFTIIALWTLIVPTLAACSVWSTLDRDYPLVIIFAIGAPLGGWLFASVMWQWNGALLEAAEKKRRQRAERASQA